MKKNEFSLDKSLEALETLTPYDLSRCSTQKARELIPYTEARKAKILPLGTMTVGAESGCLLIVATADISKEKIKEIRYLAQGFDVRTVKVEEKCLTEAIFKAYKKDSNLLEDALDKCSPEKRVSIASSISGLHEVKTVENSLLCSLFDHAIAWGASDLHITPTKEGLVISIRVDGEIRTKETEVRNESLYARLLQRIRIIAAIDIGRKEPSQEGSLVIPYLDKTIIARVSLVPSLFGESLAIRFLSKNSQISIDSLHASFKMHHRLQEITKLNSGLVLISGATGSGKTTTLYALANEIIKLNKRIISIEDPVESILPNVTQIQIDPKRNITFESCLKAVLRQDPDVLIIGEIREAPIAKAALQFAMTGHLVLATIHAGSVLETRKRFSYLVDKTQHEHQIKAVVFQKLLKNQQEPGKRVLFMQINEFFDDLTDLLEIGILSKEDYTTLKEHERVNPIATSLQTECLHDSVQ